jgi:hypothetical protein
VFISFSLRRRLTCQFAIVFLILNTVLQ